jgi:spore maturation protein CgeB
MLDLKPTLIIIVNGFSIDKNTIHQLQKNNIQVFLWVLDDPARARFSNFLEIAPVVDEIFCCSQEWLRYMSLLWKEIIFLPLCVNPDRFALTAHDSHTAKAEFDFCFIGTFIDSDQSSLFRYHLIIEIAKIWYVIRVAGKWAVGFFRNYGTHLMSNIILSNRVSESEMQEIYRKTQIVINPYNTYNQDVISLRVFEAWWLKKFQLIPFQEQLKDIFSEEEIITFENLDDLRIKADYYIQNEDEANALADAFYKSILLNHTYANRAKKLIAFQSKWKK